MVSIVVLAVVLAITISSVNSYKYNTIRVSSPTSLHAKKQPKVQSFAPPEIADIGYPPVGSLIRQGPVPFFIRLTKPDTYEAAIVKYMRQEGCDRATAQGNMDAYFQDPNGWAANKLRERAGGYQFDYVNVNTDKKSLALTAVWASGITFLFYRIIQVQVFGL